MLTALCMKVIIVNPTKASRTGFERSKRPTHGGDKGTVVTTPLGVAMSDDSEQVTALIKELLILNRADSTPSNESPTENEIEGRKSKRTRVRRELVQALHLRERKKS